MRRASEVTPPNPRFENFCETIDKVMKQPNQFGSDDWEIWMEMRGLYIQEHLPPTEEELAAEQESAFPQ